MATAVAACGLAGLVVEGLQGVVKAGPMPWEDAQAAAESILSTERLRFDEWADADLFLEADVALLRDLFAKADVSDPDSLVVTFRAFLAFAAERLVAAAAPELPGAGTVQ